MEYDTRDVFPVASLVPGQTVLGTGPPLVGERALAYRFLARGMDAGEGAILVTTTQSVDQVREAVMSYTAATDAPLAIVAMEGASYDDPGDDLCWRVSSPGDLTGIGMAITEAMETLSERGNGRFRLVIDSLSPLTVYGEFERVYRFLHLIFGRVSAVGGVAFCYLPADTVGDRASTIRGLVDGVLEFRDGEPTAEYRLEGIPTPTDGWRPVPDGERSIPSLETSDGRPVASTPDDLPDSLHELIDRLAGERQLLTIYNYGGDSALRETLEAYFSRLNVAVRTADTSVDTPRDTAVLHQGSEPVDMAPVGALERTVRIQDEDDAEAFAATERPSLLRRAENDVYRVDDDGKQFLIDISRLVEQQALDAGRGTLYTGFQQLGRIEDEYGTRRIYERLAASPVEIHLFGAPGEVPNAQEYHLHAEAGGELTDTWFVVFDGDGADHRKVALVCEETDPGRYRGFWTRRPALVEEAIGYLQERYPVPGTPSAE